MILFIFKISQSILETQDKPEITKSFNESQLNFDDDFDSDDEVIFLIFCIL